MATDIVACSNLNSPGGFSRSLLRKNSQLRIGGVPLGSQVGPVDGCLIYPEMYKNDSTSIYNAHQRLLKHKYIYHIYIYVYILFLILQLSSLKQSPNDPSHKAGSHFAGGIH